MNRPSTEPNSFREILVRRVFQQKKGNQHCQDISGLHFLPGCLSDPWPAESQKGWGWEGHLKAIWFQPLCVWQGHRTGGVRGVSSLVPLVKARETFLLLLFTSLILKAAYSCIPFLPTPSSRNSVFWRDKLQPCICEVNELQNTSKGKKKGHPLPLLPFPMDTALMRRCRCAPAPAHGPVSLEWLPVGPWELHLLTPVLWLLGVSLGARLLWLFSMQQVGDSGAALAVAAALSKDSLITQPCCPCGALLALLPLWVWCCTVAAPLRSGFGGEPACAAGLC